MRYHRRLSTFWQLVGSKKDKTIRAYLQPPQKKQYAMFFTDGVQSKINLGSGNTVERLWTLESGAFENTVADVL